MQKVSYVMYVSRMLLSRPKPKLVRLPVTVLVKLSLATQQVMREASVRLQLRMLKSISEELSVISPRKAKFPIALIQRLLKGQPVVSVGL